MVTFKIYIYFTSKCFEKYSENDLHNLAFW